MIGCVLLTTGNKPDDLALALGVPAAPDRRGDRHRGGRQRLGPDGPARRACAACTSRSTRASRPGATPASRTSTASLLFFLDDDAALADDDALARVARDLRRPARRDGPAARGSARRRPAAARLGPAAARAATAAARSDVTVVWEGAVAIRRTVFERGRRLAGGVPLRPRGRRPRLARDGRRLRHPLRRRHRRPAPRHRRPAAPLLLLLRRPQPRLAGAPPPARARSAPSTCSASWRAPSPASGRSAGRSRRRCGATVTGCASPPGRGARCKASTLWRMTRAGRPPIM